MPEHDLVAIFSTLLDGFTDRVHAVEDDQWHAPTPNLSWDVCDLVAHLITEQRWTEPLLRGLELEDAAAQVDAASSFTGVEGVDATYVQAWDETAAISKAVFTAPGALERTVSLVRGAAPSTSYLRELIFDLTIHSWDLEVAIGYPKPLPAEIVEAVWSETKQFTDLSASGLYDVPVAVPAEASDLDRLIALTGRDPQWKPSAR